MKRLAVLVLAAGCAFGTEIAPVAPEFRQPQLAAGFGKVAMVYGSPDAIWFAASSDNGATFGRPVKVADAGVLALGRHRGPRLTILKDSMLVTAVAGAEVSKAAHAHGLPDRGELFIWRSTDNGATWKKTGTINDRPAAAEEGLHAIAVDGRGNLFAAWLDHRGKGTELYGARSTDGGMTWGKNVRIYASPDGTICQCCDPSIAFDAAGKLHVMWRNVMAGSRDFYVMESSDFTHFGSPVKMGEGTWKIDACPMDGGGLAFDRQGLISVWRRESSIYMARPGAAETRLGEGKDVAVASGANGVWVAWATAQGIEVLAPGANATRHLADDGGFPAVLALGDASALVAWEADGAIRTALIQ